MKFKNKEEAARFMEKLGKQLSNSNVPISPYISRKDNNRCFDIGIFLREVGKRIRNEYNDLDY